MSVNKNRIQGKMPLSGGVPPRIPPKTINAEIDVLQNILNSIQLLTTTINEIHVQSTANTIAIENIKKILDSNVAKLDDLTGVEVGISGKVNDLSIALSQIKEELITKIDNIPENEIITTTPTPRPIRRNFPNQKKRNIRSPEVDQLPISNNEEVLNLDEHVEPVKRDFTKGSRQKLFEESAKNHEDALREKGTLKGAKGRWGYFYAADTITEEMMEYARENEMTASAILAAIKDVCKDGHNKISLYKRWSPEDLAVLDANIKLLEEFKKQGY